MSADIPSLSVIASGQPHEAVVFKGSVAALAALQYGIAAALTKASLKGVPCLVNGPSFFDAEGEEFDVVFSIEQLSDWQAEQGAEAQGVGNGEN